MDEAGLTQGINTDKSKDKFQGYKTSIYSQNVREMNSKTDEILLNTLTDRFKIIMLTETWLTSNRNSSEFFDVNLYNVVRKDRDKCYKARGGGGEF